MKKIAIILSTIAFIANGYGQRDTINENNTETLNDTFQNFSTSERVNGQEEWSFIISPPNVGLISTKNHISEIPDLLPTAYSMVKDSAIWDDTDEDEAKWEYTVFYAVRKNNKTIFEIYPNDEKDEIFSIAILSPEYKIKDTELRVGSTFGELKKTFSIRDWDFWYDLGLFVYCNGFNGVFEINAEGEGSDDPNLLELLPESKKIKTIVVYR